MADSHGSGGLPGMAVASSIHHRLHDAGYHLTAKPLIIIFAVLNVGFLFIDPYQTLRNWVLLGFFSPLWVPYILIYFTFVQWVRAKRSAFIANQKTVLLELRMPRDTKKTPLAMEAIFAMMHSTSGESTNYAKFWLGKVRTWYSLEIASLGGRIHFYIWTREGFRRGIESAFYAQYPDMEIVEAEDYTLVYDPSAPENNMFGEEYIHTKADAFPIKTYVEYGLDKAGAKPEEIIDPMAQMLELLGSIGPKEQIWVQMIIRATKSEKLGHIKTAKGDPYTWKDQAKDEIKKIREETTKKGKMTDPLTGRTIETEGFPNPTKGQSETIAAIERNISKQGFDVGLRMMYSAPKEAYHGGTVGFITTMLKPFASETYNGFKFSSVYDTRFNDYPWEDPGGHHRQHLHQELVEYFRRRAFFHDPYIGNWMVMSTEELATMFHVPSASVETPGLPRLQSTTSGAPANLPT